MLHAFVYADVAILVRHWLEVNLADSHLEHGARIEVRAREPQPHRGTESAAQRIVVDRPLWRADLFDRVDGVRGGFEAAHYHPYFDGVEPCERHWADEIKNTPWEWLEAGLRAIDDIGAAAGLRFADAEQVRADAGAIVAAARGRAAAECDSAERCHAWTRDAAHHVQLMLGQLARPDLLDRERLAPWTEAASAG